MCYLLIELRQPHQDEMLAIVTIKNNSPWFSGHFPDNPILPGIAQLQMVADVIAAARHENFSISGLSRVKFRKIVRPGEHLAIHAVAGTEKNHYTFRITSSENDVCSGMMLLTPK